MIKINFLFHILSLCLIGACAFTGAANAVEIKEKMDALGFKPHKALYNIKLDATRSGSQILNISGQMFYEWQATCDAWITNHRFNILYEYADSAPMRITSNFSTYEPFDGSELNFTSQRKRDGKLFEEIRGNANLAKNAAGSAMFTVPSDLEFVLPEGTLFPVAHSLAVAEKIREGKKFYTAKIFDGSDEEGPVSVNAFIGKSVDLDPEQYEHAAMDKELLSSPAHNIRLAFFPLYNQETTSDYEMQMVFHENSVISDMFIDYEDFSVSQKLIAIEPMEDGCQPVRFNE